MAAKKKSKRSTGPATKTVKLPKEPKLCTRLQRLITHVKKKPCNNIILDFTDVYVIIASSISHLVRLKALLGENGCRVILCNLHVSTRAVFRVTGVGGHFDFADDEAAAKASISNPRQPHTISEVELVPGGTKTLIIGSSTSMN